MLAEKRGDGMFVPIDEHGEFYSRALAREYIKGKKFEKEEIFLVRKEVAVFYDRKFVENEDY